MQYTTCRGGGWKERKEEEFDELKMNSSRDDCKNSRRLVRKSAGARNYDENLMDELIDMHLGAAPRKKRKTMQELEKETETEAMIALSLGFPIDDLLDEEIEAGVVEGGGGADRVNDYIVVRNHILSKWRDNVSNWLSIGQIRETVSKEYEALISAAYDFLTSRGFINFGVVHPPRPIDVIEAAAAANSYHHHHRHLLLLDPNNNNHHHHNNAEIATAFKKKKKKKDDDDDDDDDVVSVIVVGSGLAGLAAARQLLNFGLKVIVLEGRSRPGGRAYTERIGSCPAAEKREDEEEGGAYAAAVDLGGSVITGIHANPLGVVARQLCLPLHKVRDKCPLYWPDGVPVDEETDAKVETVFNKLLDKATQLRQLLGEAAAANISLGSAVDTLKRLYGIARSGDETQLLDWHLANLEYANAGQLSMLSLAHWDQDDPYEMGGDHCLLAGGNGKLIDALCRGIPIYYGRTVHGIKYGIAGVEVAAGDQLFQADMALCTVPLGVLKKKIISFEPELPTRKLEAISRLGYGLLNKIALIFPYVFWEEDLDTFGSVNKDGRKRGEYFLFYSYHMVSGGPVLIALVAGESASRFEQAQPTDLLHRVLSVLRGIYGRRGIEVPNPIQSMCTRWGEDPFCYGSYSHVGVGSSGADYDILAESVGDGRLFFAGEATSRQYPATMHGAFLSGLREASRILDAAKKRKTDTFKCTQHKNMDETLSLLFRTPDLAFGRFSFIFDPTGTSEGPECMGLLRMTVGMSHADRLLEPCHLPMSTVEEMQLYSTITRQQAHKLELVQGTDRNKLYALHNILGLKLVASSSLGATGDRLVANIARGRRMRNKPRTSFYPPNSH